MTDERLQVEFNPSRGMNRLYASFLSPFFHLSTALPLSRSSYLLRVSV
jgi:hypothetical protein